MYIDDARSALLTRNSPRSFRDAGSEKMPFSQNIVVALFVRKTRYTAFVPGCLDTLSIENEGFSRDSIGRLKQK
jgi:hypothetical protein